MKNFRLIQKHIDVKPFLLEIAQNEDCWRTLRASVLGSQEDTFLIMLREGVAEPGRAIIDSQISRRTAIYPRFPFITSWLEKFSRDLGELSWVLIISLQPEGKVSPHIDHGEYHKTRDRYHLVLQSREGSQMVSGGEKQTLREGELWWFNHKVEHDVFNPSPYPRIHLIFDILPKNSTV